jgi:hypothetical protein
MREPHVRRRRRKLTFRAKFEISAEVVGADRRHVR